MVNKRLKKDTPVAAGVWTPFALVKILDYCLHETPNPEKPMAANLFGLCLATRIEPRNNLTVYHKSEIRAARVKTSVHGVDSVVDVPILADNWTDTRRTRWHG
jgi:hypothetical protein